LNPKVNQSGLMQFHESVNRTINNPLTPNFNESDITLEGLKTKFSPIRLFNRLQRVQTMRETGLYSQITKRYLKPIDKCIALY
jgi:hypothetical protein